MSISFSHVQFPVSVQILRIPATSQGPHYLPDTQIFAAEWSSTFI